MRAGPWPVALRRAHSAGGSSGASPPAIDLAALEEERDFLVRSLRDLEAERAAGDIDEVDYASLKDDYTARAAAVARQIGSITVAPITPTPHATTLDLAAPDPVGSDSVGSDSVGSDTAGSDTAGSDTATLDLAGSDPVGSDRVGSDTATLGLAGSDPVGSGRVGSDTATLGLAGSGSGWSGDVGSGSVGSGGTGSGTVGSGGTGSGAVGSGPVAEPTPSGAPPAPAGVRRRWSLGSRIVAVVVVVALGAISGWAVHQATSSRQAGQTITGSQASTASSSDQVTIENELASAQTDINQQKYLPALKIFKTILAVDPDQPEALTYQGWLLAVAGFVQPGITAIEKAEKVAPTYPDAHLYRGVILLRYQHHPAAAITEFRVYLADHPSSAGIAAADQLITQARQSEKPAKPKPK